MSAEERSAVSEETMPELEEFRRNKTVALNNVPINAFHDTRKSLQLVTEHVSTEFSMVCEIATYLNFTSY